MYLTRWLIAALILSLSSYAYAVDYTVTVPDSEQARVEAALVKAYGKPVNQVLADFIITTVKNVEVFDAGRTAQKDAEALKKADIDSKLVIITK